MIYLLNGLILNYFCAVKLILQRFEKLYCFWYQDFFPKSTRISDIAHSGSKTRDQCTDCEIYPLFFSVPLALKPIIRFPSAHVRSSKPRGGYEGKEGRNESQRCVYLHCCLCLDSMSIICSCLCHAASVVSVPAMPLAPAEGGWTPPRAPPPPPPYSITAVAPYSALSLLPSAVLRCSQHGAGPLSMPHTQLLSIFPSFFPLPFLSPFLVLGFIRDIRVRLFLDDSYAIYRLGQPPWERLLLCRREKHRRSRLGSIETTSKQLWRDVSFRSLPSSLSSSSPSCLSPDDSVLFFRRSTLNLPSFEGTILERFASRFSSARARFSRSHTKNSSYLHAHSRETRLLLYLYIYTYIYLYMYMYLVFLSFSLSRFFFL